MSENQNTPQPAPERRETDIRDTRPLRRCRMLLVYKVLSTGRVFNDRCGNALPANLGPPVCDRCYGLMNACLTAPGAAPNVFLHATASVAEAIAQEARS